MPRKGQTSRLSRVKYIVTPKLTNICLAGIYHRRYGGGWVTNNSLLERLTKQKRGYRNTYIYIRHSLPPPRPPETKLFGRYKLVAHIKSEINRTVGGGYMKDTDPSESTHQRGRAGQKERTWQSKTSRASEPLGTYRTLPLPYCYRTVL